MIEYTQEDVDRMQEAAKVRVREELAAEAKAEAKTLFSEATKKSFDQWLETRKNKQI